MGGYLGFAGRQAPGFHLSRYDMPGNEPQGVALLARDRTTLEVPAVGWNYPPWGYGRNALRLAGLGFLGEPLGADAGAVDAATQHVAVAYINAIEAGLNENRKPDYAGPASMLPQVANADIRDTIIVLAESARQGFDNIFDYDDREAGVAQINRNLAELRKVASGFDPYPEAPPIVEGQPIEMDEPTRLYVEETLRPAIGRVQDQADAIGPPFVLTAAYGQKWGPLFDEWQRIWEDGQAHLERGTQAHALFGNLMNELNKFMMKVRLGDSYAWQSMRALFTGHPLLAGQLLVRQVQQLPAAAGEVITSTGQAIKELSGEKCSSWYIARNLPGSLWECTPTWAKLVGGGLLGLVAYTYLRPLFKVTAAVVGKNWRKNRRRGRR